MKIVHLRVRDSLKIAFKFVGKDVSSTREQVESSEFINNCIENNLAFFKSMPHSVYYCMDMTGKAAVAIEGTTVHTALRILISKLVLLSMEVIQEYRSLFKYIKVLIIDEVNMMSARLLQYVHSPLKQIMNISENFGRKDMIFVGDLRQLPPVRVTSIYEQTKQNLFRPNLRRSLTFYELTQVVRQADKVFSQVLTVIGNGEKLNEDQQS